jgi:hypothetical protein
MAVLSGGTDRSVPKLEPSLRGFGAFAVKAVPGDFLSLG